MGCISIGLSFPQVLSEPCETAESNSYHNKYIEDFYLCLRKSAVKSVDFRYIFRNREIIIPASDEQRERVIKLLHGVRLNEEWDDEEIYSRFYLYIRITFSTGEVFEFDFLCSSLFVVEDMGELQSILSEIRVQCLREMK